MQRDAAFDHARDPTQNELGVIESERESSEMIQAHRAQYADIVMRAHVQHLLEAQASGLNRKRLCACPHHS